VPLAGVGAAALSLSMLLSVAPALGAANNSNGGGNSSTPAGNGTSGNVKVHDAGTGEETTGTDNEPHVCAFWLGFTFDAPFEAGTWIVVSWAPTGDGSTVASGVYDTAGDGADSSSVIELGAGHYRVEWAATDATSSKKKTFWVDAGCDAPDSPAEEESQGEEPAPPTDDPGSPAEEESQAEEPAPPTDDPGSPAEEESQAEEPVPPTDDPGSPAEEESDVEEPVTEEVPVTDELVLSEEGTAPSDDETQVEGTAPSDDETQVEEVAPPDEQGTPPTDESLVDDVAAPIDVPDDEEPAQAADPGSGESGTPPIQDELGAAGGSDQPTMPDTAVPAGPVQSGLLATIGLLALVVLHASVRRDRADRDNSAPAA
jgi:hypothetical protein